MRSRSTEVAVPLIIGGNGTLFRMLWDKVMRSKEKLTRDHSSSSNIIRLFIKVWGYSKNGMMAKL